MEVEEGVFFVVFDGDGEGDGEGSGLFAGGLISSFSSSDSGSGSFISVLDEEGTGEVDDEPGIFGRDGGGGVNAWACWAATRSGFKRGLRVAVPLRTSHIEHLKASALFLKVHTLQSQAASSILLFKTLLRLKFEIFLIRKHH